MEKSGSKSCVMSILSISSSYVDDAICLIQIYRYFNCKIEPVNSTIGDSTAAVDHDSFRRKVATTVYYKAFHYLEFSGIRTTKCEAPVVEDFVSVDDIVKRTIAIVHLNSLVVWVLSTTHHKNSNLFLEIMNGPLTEDLPFSLTNLLVVFPEKIDEMWVAIKLDIRSLKVDLGPIIVSSGHILCHWSRSTLNLSRNMSLWQTWQTDYTKNDPDWKPKLLSWMARIVAYRVIVPRNTFVTCEVKSQSSLTDSELQRRFGS